MTTINACGGIMNSKKLILGAMIASAITGAQAAPYGFFDARSVGMGNVSVATGNIAIAGLSNPAMLIVNESKDSFALLIPAVGIQAIDKGGMQDLVDEYDNLQAELNANPTSQATVQSMIDTINLMDDTALLVNAAANVAIVYSGENWAFAGTYRGNAALGATINITNPGNANTLTEPEGEFLGVGVLAQEMGVSVATKFNVLGMDLAVGVTPKNVNVDAITYTQLVSNLVVDDAVSDAVEENLGSFSTVDAGVALQLTDSFTVGLVAKNLLSESLTTADGLTTFKFDTHLRAGAAWHNDWVTVAADMDLTEIEPLSFEDPSKMLALGVEFNAWDFMQLRAGYQTNMASGSEEPALYSAGIGLWLGFHLDVAAVVGADSSVGAMAQLGFRF
jgi:hypothetical protein